MNTKTAVALKRILDEFSESHYMDNDPFTKDIAKVEDWLMQNAD